jgi:hypothetical protein
MRSLVISPMELSENTVEVVERKGLGHPDTICDALAEALSQNLCRAAKRCAAPPCLDSLSARKSKTPPGREHRRGLFNRKREWVDLSE